MNIFSDGIIGFIQVIFLIGLLTPLIYFIHTGFISILKREEGSGEMILSLFFSPLLWILFFVSIFEDGLNYPSRLFGVLGLIISVYVTINKIKDIN